MTNAMSAHGTSRWVRSGEDRWTDPNEEPGLDEILSDPVVRAVMRRDGLDPCEVRVFMEQPARRLNGAGRRAAAVPFPSAHGPEHHFCA